MYADGTNQTTYLSAALKVWMEGGSYEYSGENYTFEPYGLNPYTGKQIIHVTPKVTKEFDEMTLDEMKEYDVIFFGTWDSNGGQFISNESVQRVSEYIDLGYGVLLGHDVVGSSYGREIGLGQIADKFGILLGTTDCDLSSCSNGDLPYKWRYYSNETKVTKSGFLTQFPYQLDQNSNFSYESTI
ncbi:Ig domain-containing protein [Histomonas meleagridis]|nr:Ig domain-containing protein [Histomonas meleagridis]